jgi:hypothetical protein
LPDFLLAFPNGYSRLTSQIVRVKALQGEHGIVVAMLVWELDEE